MLLLFHFLHNLFHADLTHGWWSISDTPSIDKLLRSFCLRGYREKSLFKALQKSKETFPRIFDPSNLKDCEVAFNSLLNQLSTNSVKSASNSLQRNDSEATSSAGDSADMDVEKTDSKSAAVEEDSERKEADIDTNSGVEGMQVDPQQSDADKKSSSPALGEESESKIGEGSGGSREKDNDSASDDSSDSETSSSSSSSSAAHHSSQEEEGEEENRDKAVPEKKKRLSSSGSNLILCSQLAIPMKPVHKVPPSGVFDPVFSELADQFALKVLEYVEGTEDRLFVAKLHEEVRISYSHGGGP